MSITIPDEALENPRQLLEEALCSAWSQGKIGGGKAARHLGLTRIEFWDLAGSRGYTWPYSVDDLNRDVETLKRLGI